MKVVSASVSLILGGPAGVEALERASPQELIILYDSESLSALKSNMGDREISFFRWTAYL